MTKAGVTTKALPAAAPAGTTAGAWVVTLGYTMTDTLVFTANVSQPLDGSGAWLEVFELTRAGSTSYLGWCNTGSSCTFGPTAPHAAQGQFIAVVGTSLTNHYADYPAAQKFAESSVVSPPPWTVDFTATVSDQIAFTASSNYLPSAAGAWIQIFEEQRPAGTTYLGWTQDRVYTPAPTVPHQHRASFRAVVGFTLANTYESYPEASKAVESKPIIPPAWGVEIFPGAVAVSNYSTTGSGAWIEIFDLSSTWVVSYEGWCNTGTVCAPEPRGAGPWLATVGSLSNHPVPDPLWAVSNVVDRNGLIMSLGDYLANNNPAGKANCGGCAGDPVDTYRGEFYLGANDLAVPSRGVSPTLALARTYSSVKASRDGALGLGWASILDARLSGDFVAGPIVFTQETGARATFTKQADGTFKPPAGLSASITKRADGTWRVVRKKTEVFTFSAVGSLQRVADLNNQGYTVTRATDGTVSALTGSSGRTIALTWSAGRVTRATDPTGRFVSYEYDAVGHLVKATDPAAAVTTYGYGTLDRLTSITGPTGVARTTTYDGLGRVVSQDDGMGHVLTIAYAADGSRTITSPAGRVVRDVYSAGLLTSRTAGVGTADESTTTYTYDPVFFTRATVTDGRGNTTTYTVDSGGNVIRAATATGATILATYDAFDNVLTSTSPAGTTTTNAYDTKGNLLSSSVPYAGRTLKTTFTRATNGDVRSVTDPTGAVTAYTYTAAGDVATVTDPAGAKATLSYDSAGRLLKTTTLGGSITRNEYDSRGLLSAQVDARGARTTYAYDPRRLVTSITDPLGGVTTQTYDERGLLVSTSKNSVTTRFVYDADGLLVSRTDPAGNVTSFVRDALGRVVSVTDPLGRVWHAAYDRSNNPITVTDAAGRVTTQTFDAADRRIAVHTADGVTPDVSIGYDTAGHVVSVADGTGTSTGTYDSLDRPTTVTNGNGQVVSYGWDDAGRLTQLTYPGGGQVTRTYAAGRLSKITDWLGNETTFGYDTDGRLVSRGQTGAAKQTLTLDRGGLMSATSVVDPGGQSLFGETYTRNAAGQLRTSTEGTASQTYGYTPTNELASVLPTGGTTTSFAYDAARNRLSVPSVPGVGVAHMSYDAAAAPTKYTPAGGLAVDIGYDGIGNRTSGPGPNGTESAVYSYDARSALRSATVAGATVTYTRSAQGLLGSRTTEGQTEAFAWSIGSLPALLTAGSVHFVYDDTGQVIEHISGAQARFVYGDQYGSTRLLTDATGHSVGTYRYTPEGLTAAHTGESTPLQWNGQYHDAVTGLYDLRARVYDPVTSSFLTRDPQMEATLTPYAFANNDPLNLDDPSGECPVCVAVVVGAVIGGGTDLGMQVAMNLIRGCEPFSNINWGSVGTSALIGGLTAPIPGLFEARLATRAANTACFTAGTPVLLADGSSKPIEDVEIGDKVTAFDPDTGQTETRDVVRTFVHYNVPTYQVTLETGEKVTTTEEHPFWVDGQGWTPATQLRSGDRLHEPDGSAVRVQSVRPTGQTATVYNFEVEGLHDYYVKAGNTWLLVHNWCWKSVPTFGHTFLEHGAGPKNFNSLLGRARGTGKPQGQWLNNEAAADFLQSVHVEGAGPRSVPIPEGLGQVIMPDGTVVPARVATLVPGTGPYRTAYPVLGTWPG